MHNFDYEGRRLAFVRQGQGEPVVFLHNGGTSHSIWQPQLEALAAEFTLLAPDLPGYGESDLPDSCALEAYVRMLDAFLRAQLGEQPVTLVGNCMGSAIALRFARWQPQRVRALVLINPLTAATFAAGGLAPLERLRQGLPGVTRGLATVTRHTAIPAALITPLLRRQLGARAHRLQLWENPALRACYHRPAVTAALTGLFEALPGYASLDALDTTGLPPIHTLWGRQNRVLSATAGAALNQQLQPRLALMLDDCGHLPMLERPQEVCEVIRQAAAVAVMASGIDAVQKQAPSHWRKAHPSGKV